MNESDDKKEQTVATGGESELTEQKEQMISLLSAASALKPDTAPMDMPIQPSPIEGIDEEVPMTFPQKLMRILDDDTHSDVITWLPHGKGFIIYKKKKFASEVLPQFFKQAKFTSFTRKLNRWGFTRITRGPETGAYYHKFFQKGDPRLALQMSCHSGKVGEGKDMNSLNGVVGMFGPAFVAPDIDQQNQQIIRQQLQQLQLQQMQLQQLQLQQQQQQMQAAELIRQATVGGTTPSTPSNANNTNEEAANVSTSAPMTEEAPAPPADANAALQSLQQTKDSAAAAMFPPMAMVFPMVTPTDLGQLQAGITNEASTQQNGKTGPAFAA